MNFNNVLLQIDLLCKTNTTNRAQVRLFAFMSRCKVSLQITGGKVTFAAFLALVTLTNDVSVQVVAVHVNVGENGVAGVALNHFRFIEEGEAVVVVVEFVAVNDLRLKKRFGRRRREA